MSKVRRGKGLGDEVKRAVDRGGNIQAAVRDITLKALARRELDQDSIRKVTGEVLKGAQAAVAAYGKGAKSMMEEAVAGVDRALAHAAQALKLSIEEAAGRTERFSGEDLAKARESLKNLEKLFLDALRETSAASRGAASSVLGGLLQHAQASGTAVGGELAQSISGLTGSVAEAGRAQFRAGLDAAVSSGVMMARIASGVLAGIADSLAEKSKDRPG